jgi:hypothetical protein
MSIDISEEVRATHAALSPAALDFLSYVAADPETRARPLPLPKLPPWVRVYPMQAWPILLGAARTRQIEEDMAGVLRLVKSIPERVFGNDAKRLDLYYRLGDERTTALRFAPPTGLAGAITRCDFLDTPSGPKVVEVNSGPTAGGWEMRFLAEHYRRAPVLARFFAERGLEPVARDSWSVFFRHLAEEVRSVQDIPEGEINVALVTPETDTSLLVGVAHFTQAYREALSGLGLTGRILAASYPGAFAVEGGTRLTLEGLRVHALIESTSQDTPDDVYRCFKAGELLLYNGPLSRVLGDKRNLALLSEHAESGLFSAEERTLIARCIPWSRAVEDRAVTWQGDEAPLLDLLRRERLRFVLKPGTGLNGNHVMVGPRVAPEVWEQTLARAAAEGTWVAQEAVTSRPYLGQAGEMGAVPHEVVWGIFCFGERYGGGFLRMMPCGTGDGVINSARGAVEGLLFEV